MTKQTFNSLIDQMEAAAEKSGDAQSFWQKIALVLQVWRSGWMPVVKFDPIHQPGLRDLEDAYRRFGSSLVAAANQRAFA